MNDVSRVALLKNLKLSPFNDVQESYFIYNLFAFIAVVT
jgi:hypothetical protein